MKMKCNNRLLRLSVSLTLISLVVTAANANNGQAGISPVAAMTMKESILSLSIATPR